jgi:hypothetical protein
MAMVIRAEWIGKIVLKSLYRKLSLCHLFLVQAHRFIPVVATHYYGAWFLGLNTKCVEEAVAKLLDSDLMREYWLTLKKLGSSGC